MDNRALDLIWMPTFRCNLSCAFCAARSLPVRAHGIELPPAEWIEIFAACPHEINQVALTGGEPSIYRGLADVISAGHWRICIDTNLRVAPETWLRPDDYDRVKAVNAGLQWDPDHEEAARYWQHLRWLVERLPAAHIAVCHTVLWRDRPEMWDRARAHTEASGAHEYRQQAFDDTFLWRDRWPQTPGRRAQCAAGYDAATIMPDSSVYRCIGHCYYKVQCLGNLKADGWGILLPEPEPCEVLFCTTCDQANKAAIEEARA